MSGSPLAFESSIDMVEELVSRETFSGIVVYQPNCTKRQKPGSSGEVRVEIAAGLSNEEANRLLLEIQKVLTQFIV